MATYLLALAAYADLEDIDRYTLDTWGSVQRDHYISTLFHQFEVIASSPDMGRLRPELKEGVRSLPVLEHVVFYEQFENNCYVLRILHHRRDPALVFP